MGSWDEGYDDNIEYEEQPSWSSESSDTPLSYDYDSSGDEWVYSEPTEDPVIFEDWQEPTQFDEYKLGGEEDPEPYRDYTLGGEEDPEPYEDYVPSVEGLFWGDSEESNDFMNEMLSGDTDGGVMGFLKSLTENKALMAILASAGISGLKAWSATKNKPSTRKSGGSSKADPTSAVGRTISVLGRK